MGIMGQLAWVRTPRGVAIPEKRDADIFKNAMPDTIKARKQITIQTFDLDDVNWRLSLTELAIKFPQTLPYGESYVGED